MRIILLILGLYSTILAQVTPDRFRLAKTAIDSTLSYFVDSTSVAGLGSNSSNDIQAAGDS